MGTSKAFPGPVGERWRKARGRQTAWLQGKVGPDIGLVADGYLTALRAGSSGPGALAWPELPRTTRQAAEALVETVDAVSHHGPASVLDGGFLSSRGVGRDGRFAAAVADRVAGPGNRLVDVIMRAAALRTARLLYTEAPRLRDEIRYLERAAAEEGATALGVARARSDPLLDEEVVGVLLRAFLGDVLSESILALAAEQLCAGFPGAAAIEQEEAVREWAHSEVARLVPDPCDGWRQEQSSRDGHGRSAADVARALVPDAVRHVWHGDAASDPTAATAGPAAGDVAGSTAGEAEGWTPATAQPGREASEATTAAASGVSTTRSGLRTRPRRAGLR